MMVASQPWGFWLILRVATCSMGVLRCLRSRVSSARAWTMLILWFLARVGIAGGGLVPGVSLARALLLWLVMLAIPRGPLVGVLGFVGVLGAGDSSGILVCLGSGDFQGAGWLVAVDQVVQEFPLLGADLVDVDLHAVPFGGVGLDLEAGVLGDDGHDCAPGNGVVRVGMGLDDDCPLLDEVGGGGGVLALVHWGCSPGCGGGVSWPFPCSGDHVQDDSGGGDFCHKAVLASGLGLVEKVVGLDLVDLEVKWGAWGADLDVYCPFVGQAVDPVLAFDAVCHGWVLLVVSCRSGEGPAVDGGVLLTIMLFCRGL